MFKTVRFKRYLRTGILMALVASMFFRATVPATAAPNIKANTEDRWGQFVVKAVRNIDSTDPEWLPWENHISLAATMLSKHGVDVIEHTDLGYFSEGEVKYYEDWILAELPIEDTSDFARVTLSLVEVDLGGKEEILARIAAEENRLAQENMLIAAEEKINEMASLAVSAANSDITPAEEVAIIMAFAIVYVSVAITAAFISTIWASIAQIGADDPFALQYAEIPEDHLATSGSAIFTGHGGQYRIDYEWRWVDKGLVTAAQDNGLAATVYDPVYSFADLNDQIEVMWENARRDIANQSNVTFLPVFNR